MTKPDQKIIRLACMSSKVHTQSSLWNHCFTNGKGWLPLGWVSVKHLMTLVNLWENSRIRECCSLKFALEWLPLSLSLSYKQNPFLFHNSLPSPVWKSFVPSTLPVTLWAWKLSLQSTFLCKREKNKIFDGSENLLVFVWVQEKGDECLCGQLNSFMPWIRIWPKLKS